jgi:hypothetical protein
MRVRMQLTLDATVDVPEDEYIPGKLAAAEDLAREMLISELYLDGDNTVIDKLEATFTEVEA